MSKTDAKHIAQINKIVDFYGDITDLENSCYHYFQRGEKVPQYMYENYLLEIEKNIIEFQNCVNQREKYSLPVWLTYLYLKYDPLVRMEDDISVDDDLPTFFSGLAIPENSIEIDIYGLQMEYFGNRLIRNLLSPADARRLLDLQVKKMARLVRELHTNVKGHHYMASLSKRRYVTVESLERQYAPTTVEDRMNSFMEAIDRTPVEERILRAQVEQEPTVHEIMVVNDQFMYKCMQEYTQYIHMLEKCRIYEEKVRDGTDHIAVPDDVTYTGWIAALFTQTGAKTIDIQFKIRTYEMLILPGMIREASISTGLFDIPEISPQVLCSVLYGNLYANVSKRIATVPIHLWPEIRLANTYRDDSYEWEIRTSLVVSFFFFLFSIYHREFFGKSDNVKNYIVFDSNYMAVDWNALNKAAYIKPYLVYYRRSWYLIQRQWVARFHGNYCTEYALREWTRLVLGERDQLYDIVSMVDENELPVVQTGDAGEYTMFAPMRETQFFF